MKGSSSSTRYSAAVRGLHWFGFLLIVVVYALAELRGFAPRGSAARSGMMAGHIGLGVLVAVLVLPRLIARVLSATPPIVPAPAALPALFSKLTFLAIYAFLLVQPLLGVLMIQAGGHDVTLPLLSVNLPTLIGADPELHEMLEDVHVVLGKVFYAVFALHIGAAIWHHRFIKDNTLQRML